MEVEMQEGFDDQEVRIDRGPVAASSSAYDLGELATDDQPGAEGGGSARGARGARSAKTRRAECPLPLDRMIVLCLAVVVVVLVAMVAHLRAEVRDLRGDMDGVRAASVQAAREEARTVVTVLVGPDDAVANLTRAVASVREEAVRNLTLLERGMLREVHSVREAARRNLSAVGRLLERAESDLADAQELVRSVQRNTSKLGEEVASLGVELRSELAATRSAGDALRGDVQRVNDSLGVVVGDVRRASIDLQHVNDSLDAALDELEAATTRNLSDFAREVEVLVEDVRAAREGWQAAVLAFDDELERANRSLSGRIDEAQVVMLSLVERLSLANESLGREVAELQSRTEDTFADVERVEARLESANASLFSSLWNLESDVEAVLAENITAYGASLKQLQEDADMPLVVYNFFVTTRSMDLGVPDTSHARLLSFSESDRFFAIGCLKHQNVDGSWSCKDFKYSEFDGNFGGFSQSSAALAIADLDAERYDSGLQYRFQVRSLPDGGALLARVSLSTSSVHIYRSSAASPMAFGFLTQVDTPTIAFDPLFTGGSTWYPRLYASPQDPFVVSPDLYNASAWCMVLWWTGSGVSSKQLPTGYSCTSSAHQSVQLDGVPTLIVHAHDRNVVPNEPWTFLLQLNGVGAIVEVQRLPAHGFIYNVTGQAVYARITYENVGVPYHGYGVWFFEYKWLWDSDSKAFFDLGDVDLVDGYKPVRLGGLNIPVCWSNRDDPRYFLFDRASGDNSVLKFNSEGEVLTAVGRGGVWPGWDPFSSTYLRSPVIAGRYRVLFRDSSCGSYGLCPVSTRPMHA